MLTVRSKATMTVTSCQRVARITLMSGSVARYLALALLICAACNPVRGCAESDFDLAQDSRLPKWFTLPSGVARSQVTVKMTYYTPITGPSTARFLLLGADGRALADVEGPVRDQQPQTLTPAPTSGPLPYPIYEVVTIDGITEVIEHRRRDAVFHITDDAKVKKAIGANSP